MIKVTPQEFTLLSKYIHEISGISLAAGKEYLIETRLNPIIAKLGCKSFQDLHSRSKADRTKAIEKLIIDAISTNETYFFRDKSPFDLLQHKIIPDLIDKKTSGGKIKTKTNLRIWSAANSTGQEIYSIAMTLRDLGIGLSGNTYVSKLMGTDISDAAIAQASYGRYNKFEVARGMDQSKLNKYFTPDGDHWRVKDELRAMVMFKKMNLMEPFVGLGGKFDIIFCRNVAIYFTPQDRKKLYEKIAGVLEPNGYLIIGSTESLSQDTNMFKSQKYLRSVFYQLA